MIICFSGTPGSGKTYDTVRKILDNLKLGRKVYTNVEGLDLPECREFIKVYTGLDDYQIGSQLFFLTPAQVLRFWEADTVVSNAGTEFESSREQLICEPGSMIIIDEVHKFFNARNWNSQTNKDFCDWSSTHRHAGYDLILITQDVEKIDKQVRSLVEWTYVYRKINFLGGLVKASYIVYSYTGDDSHGRPLATEKRMYKKEIFRCYQSYVSKDMKEQGFMKHTNILSHPVFYAIPLVIFAFMYMFFAKSSFATGDLFGSKKIMGQKPAVSAPAPGALVYKSPVVSMSPPPAGAPAAPAVMPRPVQLQPPIPQAIPQPMPAPFSPPMPVQHASGPPLSLVGIVGNDVTLSRGNKLIIVADGSKIDGCKVKYPSLICN